MSRSWLLHIVNLAGAIAIASACHTPNSPAAPSGFVTPAIYTVAGIVTVTTARGVEPVEGAEVRETVSMIGATTDAEGHYRLVNVPEGHRFVRVTKPGLVTQTRAVRVDADTQLDVLLERVLSFTLSGIVYEVTGAGHVPVADVELYCDSCGSPVGHTFTSTEADGSYSFEWSANGVHILLVSKPGYALPRPSVTYGGRFEGITATVTGDTRFDFELVRK